MNSIQIIIFKSLIIYFAHTLQMNLVLNVAVAKQIAIYLFKTLILSNMHLSALYCKFDCNNRKSRYLIL